MPVLEAAILGTAFKFGTQGTAIPGNSPAIGIWILRGGVCAAFAILLLDAGAIRGCFPHGEWDAQFIWNIRGKFLAGGPNVWRAATTASVDGVPAGVAHPDYPLLVSSFAGRAWALDDGFDPAIPFAAGVLFAVSLVCVLAGGLARVTSEAAGLIAAAALLGCELFASWSAAQYADIPVALYALSSIATLAWARVRDWALPLLLLSGFFAGAAAWTKNEGIAFVAWLLAAALWFGGRRAIAWVAVGAIPMIALTAAFKVFLAAPSSAGLAGSLADIAAGLGQGERWWLVLSSFAMNLYAVAPWWAHPVLLLGIAAYVLGWLPAPERNRNWRLLVASLGLLLTDAAVLLTTPHKLDWNLNTATDRLVLQVLPCLIFVVSMSMRAPVATVVTEKVEDRSPKSRRKSKNR
jgi:hypothetical protein